MPLKDRDAKLAYQRKWYAEHRERVIAKVKKRKYEVYGGVCQNCGGPTIGQSKGQAAQFCGKPECKSVQHKQNREVFVEAGKRGGGVKGEVHASEKSKRLRKLREKDVASLTEVADVYSAEPKTRQRSKRDKP